MFEIEALYDDTTHTLTYLVWDPSSRDAVVIDPVMDFDPIAVRTSSESVERVAELIESKGLTLRGVLDTHAHADHLSGMALLKERYACESAVGSAFPKVQGLFKGLMGLDHLAEDGSQFDHLLDDGEELSFGSVAVKAIHTPGHTPACTSFLIGDALFTGDSMFMPDFGTGRCDFPAGSAEDLFDSVTRKLYTLPPETRVFVGHDYQPGGRELRYETTIGDSMRENIQLRGDTNREEFVTWRSERDATLKLPKLIFQSVQVNANAGVLPPPNEAGVSVLKVPMNAL